MNQDPPEPQKVWFYYNKTHVFRDPTYTQKVTKMTPKRPPNDPQSTPWAPKGPSGTPKNRTENTPRKKTPKRPKKKPVLASEREARSRLEHCRKNVSQLLHSKDEQTQMQQE